MRPQEKSGLCLFIAASLKRVQPSRNRSSRPDASLGPSRRRRPALPLRLRDRSPHLSAASRPSPRNRRGLPPPAINAPLNAPSGPVVGWLAIIAGPGRGEILRLGYGINDIGSGPNARVRLNFGDPAIAPENHAAIIYATRSRRFYLAQSIAAETRRNGEPVQESVELTSGDTVGFGQTQLRFVPLCGPDFDWRDGS